MFPMDSFENKELQLAKRLAEYNISKPMSFSFETKGAKLTKIEVDGEISESLCDSAIKRHGTLKRKNGRPKKVQRPRGGTTQTVNNELIITLLLTNGHMSLKEIEESSHVSIMTAYSCVHSLLDLGIIEIVSKRPIVVKVCDDKNKIFAYEAFRAIQTIPCNISRKKAEEIIEENLDHFLPIKEFKEKVKIPEEDHITIAKYKKFKEAYEFAKKEKKRLGINRSSMNY